MKNIKQILKYSLLTSLSIVALSCDSDEGEVDYAQGNSYPVLREDTISSFDIDETLTFDVFVEPGATLSSLEIYNGEEKLGDAVVGEGDRAENTATFSSSILLPFEFEGEKTLTYDLTVLSTGTNGDVGRTFLSLNVISPLSFDQEIAEVVYGDDVNAVDENGDLITNDKVILFDAFTLGAVIDDISLFWKNGSEGTYVKDETKTFEPTGGSIDLKELDYVEYGLSASDTLHYQVIATSGLLEEAIETSVILVPAP